VLLISTIWVTRAQSETTQKMNKNRNKDKIHEEVAARFED